MQYMYVLGIHLGHDSSCAIVKDGKVVAAVSEERFTRLKHYSQLPLRSLKFCLENAKVDISEIDLVVIPSLGTPPEIKTLLSISEETNFDTGELVERDISFYVRMFLVNVLKKLNKATRIQLPAYIKRYHLGNRTEIMNIEHHLAHASSAYYTSGFDERTVIVTADGAGDGLSTAVWLGYKNKIKPLMRIGRNGSLGGFYATVTEALGWEVGDGEGKTMGLAPYGNTKKTKGVLEFIRPRFKNGVLIKKYDWGFPGILRDMGTEHWHFDKSIAVKKLIEKYGKENVAAEAQRVLEEELVDFVSYWIKKTDVKYLTSAGGVFLNVKANQRILETGLLNDYYIYPDAGDAGLSIGAALFGYYSKNLNKKPKKLDSVYFGPEYSDLEIERILKLRNLKFRKLSRKSIVDTSAKLLAKGKIIGWFQGKGEIGPRALGNRSILMDPRKARNKDIINARVKFREGFRPFCPSVTLEDAGKYFKNINEAPFMIISYDVIDEKQKDIPAVTHVDKTARPQTVSSKQNPLYYSLIKEFGRITGIPVLLNTSLNIKGEPVVNSPQDAIRCFYDTGLDYLVIGNFILEK